MCSLHTGGVEGAGDRGWAGVGTSMDLRVPNWVCPKRPHLVEEPWTKSGGSQRGSQDVRGRSKVRNCPQEGPAPSFASRLVQPSQQDSALTPCWSLETRRSIVPSLLSSSLVGRWANSASCVGVMRAGRQVGEEGREEEVCGRTSVSQGRTGCIFVEPGVK